MDDNDIGIMWAQHRPDEAQPNVCVHDGQILPCEVIRCLQAVTEANDRSRTMQMALERMIELTAHVDAAVAPRPVAPEPMTDHSVGWECDLGTRHVGACEGEVEWVSEVEVPPSAPGDAPNVPRPTNGCPQGNNHQHQTMRSGGKIGYVGCDCIHGQSGIVGQTPGVENADWAKEAGA